MLRRALVRHHSRHEALLGWLFGRLLVTECVLRRWSRDDERRDAECTQVLRGNGYEVDRTLLEMLEGLADKENRNSVGHCLALAREGALVMMSRQGTGKECFDGDEDDCEIWAWTARELRMGPFRDALSG